MGSCVAGINPVSYTLKDEVCHRDEEHAIYPYQNTPGTPSYNPKYPDDSMVIGPDTYVIDAGDTIVWREARYTRRFTNAVTDAARGRVLNP